MSRWTPAVGDIWEDVDPRGGRRFRIVGFETNKDGWPCAVCRGGEDGSGRRTLVRLDRFHEKSRSGYRYITPSPPPQPALDRISAEADESEVRYVAQRERAERAEAAVAELERRMAAMWREHDEAVGELLELLALCVGCKAAHDLLSRERP